MALSVFLSSNVIYLRVIGVHRVQVRTALMKANFDPELAILSSKRVRQMKKSRTGTLATANNAIDYHEGYCLALLYAGPFRLTAK